MIIPHNIIYSMTEFDDIINVQLLRKKYSEYEQSLSAEHPRRVGTIVKEFIEFIRYIKSYTRSDRLLNLLKEQEKVARRILILGRVKYFLFFLYNTLVNTLIMKLLNLIRILISII
ncbi:hypothetical protein CM19_11110 [Candidatus Acidianus copahuensis]|uniref:Uncharacterized protein n=1 Tax=Candidatus Acidianus copahuensis TaxID=1160895 RepID=A0A031LKD3_9CREN|nr:hypothetical protein [Candidatus Acidianus copahuensis]EZQ02016.1 hypothetical protein CM19_11110 [Candidatus Acidianus copahuensis]